MFFYRIFPDGLNRQGIFLIIQAFLTYEKDIHNFDNYPVCNSRMRRWKTINRWHDFG